MYARKRPNKEIVIIVFGLHAAGRPRSLFLRRFRRQTAQGFFFLLFRAMGFIAEVFGLYSLNLDFITTLVQSKLFFF